MSHFRGPNLGVCHIYPPPKHILIPGSFGGTDGQYHYNDTWSFDINTRIWTELDCIGFIPSPREGHSAALVDDVMYVFGGRGVDGKDLGDLAAFKLSSANCHVSLVMMLTSRIQINGGTCSKTWALLHLADLDTPWLLSAQKYTF